MATDVSSVETLRAEFPALERWTHFALAHKAPLPRCAEDAFEAFARDFRETGGRNAYDMERIEEARNAVSALVGAPASSLAFVKNTSEGIGLVATGLGLGAGDEVVLSAWEHEANLLPWRRLAADGVAITLVDGGTEALLDRIGPKTRVVAASWVTYGGGYRFDLETLGAACREHDAILVVDGIQGVGVLANRVDELGADVIACGGHKGLLGVAGAGFLYCRDELISRIEPPYAAKFSFASSDKLDADLELASDAHRFEYGNPNFLGISILKRSAELISKIGLENIEARVRSLTTRLIVRLEASGLDLVTPREWTRRAGIVSVTVPDPHAAAARLHERQILVSVKDDRYLRTSTHFYNTEEEVERLAREIAACA